jgi:PAS domain S-box-containing protein
LSILKSLSRRLQPASLTSRVFALYGLTLTAFVFGGIGLFIRFHVLSQAQDTEAASTMLIEVVSQAVQDSVVIGDYDTVRKVLEKGVRGSAFSSASFIDLNGGRIDAEAPRPVSSRAGRPPRWLNDWVDEQLYDVNRPLTVGGRDYGILRLHYDTYGVADQIWGVMVAAVLLGAFSLLIGLMLIRVPIKRWLGGLERLRGLVEAIGKDQADVEQYAISEHDPIEIRRVAEMINRTATLLAEREASRRALDDQKFALDQHAIVSITDSQGVITYANDHFCAITGYSREELLGRNHRIINAGVHPRSFFEEIWHTISSGQVWQGEMCNRSRSGALFWVRATLVPLLGRDGLPQQYVAIRTDITDRKRAEHELANQRAFFERISETLGEGLYAQDPDGRCTYMNAEAERLLGWTRAEMIGRNVHDTLHTTAEGLSIPRHECPIHLKVQENGEAHLDDQHFMRKDGSIFPVVLVSKTLYAPDGHAEGTVVAFQDISTRLEAQAAILKAKEDAEQASRVKGNFLANMSHEIRTPLNGIIGMTGLALDTELNDEQREYVSMVKSSADALLDIVNDILDFSKIEAGRMDIEHIEFSLEKMLRETLKGLALRAHQKKLELMLRVEHDVPERLVGDPGRLRQVLINLVGNAIKFTERGEIEVTVRRVNDPAQRQAELRFSVRDTGIGIAPDKVERVFESFTQADTSTTRRYGGTGLGLTISSQLVQLMGGRLGVDSTLGQGSTFHFQLSMPVVAIETGRERSARGLNGLPVLIADDNATNRRLLSETLKSWRMRPIAVANARDALAEFERAAAADKPYPLALIDLQMPDMSGFELVESLSRNHTEVGATVMMLTSEGQRGHGARCRELGVASYLVKPISQSELFDAIMVALGEQSQSSTQLITRHSLRETQRKFHLLLAEDNPINQTLATRLLENLGHRVTLARDGIEAVEQWQQGQFDAILMDVDMPRMNGYDATERIRALELAQDGDQHIPIIAMTAHAMKGAREECLRHGMDSYLTKPIDTEALWLELDALAQDMPVRDEPLSLRPEPEEEAAPAALVADFVRARETMDNDDDLFDELAQMCLRDVPAQLELAQQACAAGEHAAVRSAAHAIKGMLGMFVAERAVAAAAELEHIAQQAQPQEQALAELSATVAEFLTALEHHRSESAERAAG